jgi:hypothetical protein
MTPRRMDISNLLAARAAQSRQVSTIIGLKMRPDTLDTNDGLPACKYSLVNSDPLHDLSGSSAEAQTRVQFDCIAETRNASNKLAYAIRDVLDGFVGLLTYDDVDFARVYDCSCENHYTRWEPESPGSAKGRYRTVIDFVVSHTEPEPSLTPE